MPRTLQNAHMVICQCGKVALRAEGAPIVTAVCYCASCQAAGKILSALPGANPVLDSAGGTSYMLYRKDRVTCLRGARHLGSFRLKPESSTRRVVATCCNTAMFVDATKTHWLTFYRDRLPKDEQPPLDMRVMTGASASAPGPTPAIPAYRTHAGRFFWRLLTAWAAMGFKTPRIDYVKGRIESLSD